MEKESENQKVKWNVGTFQCVDWWSKDAPNDNVFTKGREEREC